MPLDVSITGDILLHHMVIIRIGVVLAYCELVKMSFRHHCMASPVCAVIDTVQLPT